MKENTNKSLVINSVILYARLALTTVFSLLTTRFALQALGVNDFGLFSVMGSVIAFIAIVNTIMLSTSNRFIAVAIGLGDEDGICEQFNINLLIHVCIAAATLLLAYPLGEWYINNHLNFDGSLSVAKAVFYLSVVGSAVSFVSVPYNGLLMAKEKFIVFCSVETLCSFLKLVLALAVLKLRGDRLLIYAAGVSFLSALPTIIYAVYCKLNYNRYVKLKFVRNKDKYKEVLSFSVWVGYGAVACMGKSQGAALIVNTFFNTVMNTALGIANNVNAMVSMVANTVTQPIIPQLTKAYAAGEYARADRLLVLSIKLGYFAMFLIAAPLLMEMEWILKLWLGEVPPYAVAFSKLMVIDALAVSVNSGISTIIFASGKIKLYQVVINTLRLLAIVAGYFVLKAGSEPEGLLITYIVFSVLIIFVMQYILHKTLNYDSWYLFKKAYLPSILLTLCFMPFMFILHGIYPILRMTVAVAAVLGLIFIVGLSKEDRTAFNGRVRSLISKRLLRKV